MIYWIVLSILYGMNSRRNLLLLPFLILLSGCDPGYERGGELIPSSSPYVKDAGSYIEVIAYGDAGKGNEDQYTNAALMADYAGNTGFFSGNGNSIDFVINLGDNFYPDGVTSVDDPKWNTYFESVYAYDSLKLPFYTILGNHDYYGNITAQLNYNSPDGIRWQMPSRFYKETRTIEPGTTAEFYFLDTERLFYGDAEQLVWLKENLENSTARWIIVSGHKPLYSYSKHGPNGTLITRLRPLFDNKVDLYISGHEHDIQIIEPIKGVNYIVNGAGGGSRESGIADNTILAMGRTGFVGLLMSANDLVCRVISTNDGLVYTQILKQK